MDVTPDLTRHPRDPVKPEAIAPALFAHFVVRTSNYDARRIKRC
jgi:hypothetical protein